MITNLAPGPAPHPAADAPVPASRPFGGDPAAAVATAAAPAGRALSAHRNAGRGGHYRALRDRTARAGNDAGSDQQFRFLSPLSVSPGPADTGNIAPPGAEPAATERATAGTYAFGVNTMALESPR